MAHHNFAFQLALRLDVHLVVMILRIVLLVLERKVKSLVLKFHIISIVVLMHILLQFFKLLAVFMRFSHHVSGVDCLNYRIIFFLGKLHLTEFPFKRVNRR